MKSAFKRYLIQHTIFKYTGQNWRQLNNYLVVASLLSGEKIDWKTPITITQALNSFFISGQGAEYLISWSINPEKTYVFRHKSCGAILVKKQDLDAEGDDIDNIIQSLNLSGFVQDKH